ncbi:tetratricopeptide repeat protein [bacterium]|nr:tetratricopeptide repeat protein [bacterium]
MRKFTTQILVLSLALVHFAGIGAKAAMANTPDINKSPVPGATFTKVEDLDPNKTAAESPIKRKWAVVVGMSKFKERRLQSDDLKNSQAAEEFYQFLTSEQGGRFSPKQTRLITNLKATRDNVLNTLGSSWLGSLAGPDDLVVVFISTSSFPTTDGGAYLCAYDCALDNVYGTCLSMKDLMTTLRKNVKAKRVVLIIQAAYSGAANLDEGAKALDKKMNFDPEQMVSGSGCILISSSKPNQMSWGNIFSKNLIASLKLKDGMISLEEAFEKAKQQTETDTTAYAGRYTAKQTPMLKSDWKGKDLSIGVPALEQIDELPANVTEFLAAESYFFKANSLVSEGKLDEALVQYKKAIDTDPKYSKALNDYGAILALKGNLPQAAEMLQRAIKENPGEALFRTNYAQILSRMGKQEESINQLKEAYELNPKDQVVLTALARQMISKNDPDTAVNLLSQAVKLYPKSSGLHNQLSYALARSGDVSNALVHANKAVELDPKSAAAHINLGSTMMIEGNLKGAQSAYEKAVTIEPDNANAHYLLSKTYGKNGDKSMEKTELQKFIELLPEKDPRKAKAQEQLNSL